MFTSTPRWQRPAELDCLQACDVITVGLLRHKHGDMRVLQLADGSVSVKHVRLWLNVVEVFDLPNVDSKLY